VRALVVLLALVSLALGACGGERDEAMPPPAPEAPAPSTRPDRPRAPEIEGTGLDGERLSLADLRGRAVIVNVWSSW